jgi:microsomal dipeptidase-like Zn-dependent dipeptidase
VVRPCSRGGPRGGLDLRPGRLKVEAGLPKAKAPEAIAAAIAQAVRVAGVDHVGLGSDFDGAVTTGFDTAQLAAVTQALIDRGFSDRDVAKIMGGNVLRVLRAGIVPDLLC